MSLKMFSLSYPNTLTFIHSKQTDKSNIIFSCNTRSIENDKWMRFYNLIEKTKNFQLSEISAEIEQLGVS